MGKVREQGLRRGRWPQWTVDSEQKRVTPLTQGKGKWEMGKVREKGLRRGKTAFCRGATHRKTSFE